MSGLAIQWGLIGEVGLVLDIHGMYKKDVKVAGTEPQSIRSCLSTLDQFLCEPHAVLSCFVPARESLTHRTGRSEKTSLREVVARILGSYYFIPVIHDLLFLPISTIESTVS